MRSQTKERVKDISGGIGIVLLILFLIQVILHGSVSLQKAHDQCTAKGGTLNKEYFCIQQPK